jgi:hypothetical protein
MGTPTTLGKYALDPTPLGQGPMGVVSKGFDPDLRQAVAIKVIRRELVDGPGRGADAPALQERGDRRAAPAPREHRPGVRVR